MSALRIDWDGATDGLSVRIYGEEDTAVYSGYAPDRRTYKDLDTNRKISRATWIKRTAERLDVGVASMQRAVEEIEESYAGRQAAAMLCGGLCRTSDWWTKRKRTAVLAVCKWMRAIWYDAHDTQTDAQDVFIRARGWAGIRRGEFKGDEILEDPMQALRDGTTVRMIRNAKIYHSPVTGVSVVRDRDKDKDSRHPLSDDYWSYVCDGISLEGLT